jgi:hypothetical protein
MPKARAQDGLRRVNGGFVVRRSQQRLLASLWLRAIDPT